MKIRSHRCFDDQFYDSGDGTKPGTSHKTIDNSERFFKVKANELFKIAIRSMAEISLEMLGKAGYMPDDVY